MRPRRIVFALAPLLLAACASEGAPERAPFAPPDPSPAVLDEYGVAAEYRQPFTARGVQPTRWTARVVLGEARIRIAGGRERRIPLLAPYRCFVVGCEGVMIEQKVAHRHHGVSILRQPCRIPGEDRDYPYRITVSVLRGALDREGVTYLGCGAPEGAARAGGT